MTVQIANKDSISNLAQNKSNVDIRRICESVLTRRDGVEWQQNNLSGPPPVALSLFCGWARSAGADRFRFPGLAADIDRFR